MPFHKVYADGSPRPFFRGWLHGIATLVAIPLLLHHTTLMEFASTKVASSSESAESFMIGPSSSFTILSSTLPAPAAPGLYAIGMTLIFSSLVHLVPWRSARVLEVLVRCDKTGILAICGTSFYGPQLLVSGACKVSTTIAWGTVVLPVGLAIAGMWIGLGPIVFVGCAIAFGQTLWFYGFHVDDSTFFWHSLACAVLYGSGLALYVLQLGGSKRYWGYHEWMHLFVTLGFLVNARGLLLMSQYTDEICTGNDLL